VEARAKALKDRWDAEEGGGQENGEANQEGRVSRKSLGSFASSEKTLQDVRSVRQQQAQLEGVVERNIQLEAQISVDKAKKVRAEDELAEMQKELAEEKKLAAKARVRVRELEEELEKEQAAHVREQSSHEATKDLLTEQQLSGLVLREQVQIEKINTERQKSSKAVMEKESEGEQRLAEEKMKALEDKMASVRAANDTIEAAHKSLMEQGNVSQAIKDSAEESLRDLKMKLEETIEAKAGIGDDQVQQLQEQASTFQDLCDTMRNALDDDKARQRGAEKAVGNLVERLTEAQQVAQFQMLALQQQVVNLSAQAAQPQPMLMALPPPSPSRPKYMALTATPAPLVYYTSAPSRQASQPVLVTMCPHGQPKAHLPQPAGSFSRQVSLQNLGTDPGSSPPMPLPQTSPRLRSAPATPITTHYGCTSGSSIIAGPGGSSVNVEAPSWFRLLPGNAPVGARFSNFQTTPTSAASTASSPSVSLIQPPAVAVVGQTSSMTAAPGPPASPSNMRTASGEVPFVAVNSFHAHISPVLSSRRSSLSARQGAKREA